MPDAIFVSMKPYYALAVTFLMVACSSPEVRQHTALMQTIENNLRLPQEAGKIEKFGRAYKFGSPNRVEAFYFVPNVQHDDRFCEGAKGGGRTNGQIVLACPPPDGMKAGERRWFDNDVHLPSVNDGGCNYVDVVYDIRLRKVFSARCHGVG